MEKDSIIEIIKKNEHYEGLIDGRKVRILIENRVAEGKIVKTKGKNKPSLEKLVQGISGFDYNAIQVCDSKSFIGKEGKTYRDTSVNLYKAYVKGSEELARREGEDNAKIAPLAEIFKKLVFINRVVTSFGGYYWSDEPSDHKAYLFVDIKKGHEISIEHFGKDMIRRVNEVHLGKVEVIVERKLGDDLGCDETRYNWFIEIKPFLTIKDPDKKRRVTDKAIKTIIDFVKENDKYLEEEIEEK